MEDRTCLEKAMAEAVVAGRMRLKGVMVEVVLTTAVMVVETEHLERHAWCPS